MKFLKVKCFYHFLICLRVIAFLVLHFLFVCSKQQFYARISQDSSLNLIVVRNTPSLLRPRWDLSLQQDGRVNVESVSVQK
jgi:hypothetical protein